MPKPDFSGIELTKGRAYDPDMAARLNDSLSYLSRKQRAIAIADMMEESGLDPLARSEDGKYEGLIQWGADRYRITSDDREKELTNQLQELRKTINNVDDGKSWTHGGKGSGYNSRLDAYKIFNDTTNSLEDMHRAFSYGFVRPTGKEDSHINRLKVAEQVYQRILDADNSNTAIQNNYWTTMGNAPYKADGGKLDKPKFWDDLSIKEKAAMMEVAIKNGITALPEIKEAYNKFAEGGPEEAWTLEDEAGFNAWKKDLPENLKDTDEREYDMRSAYKANMQPVLEEDGWHLGSRDPKTGKILKSPTHPTYPLALWYDMKEGYYPVKTLNGYTYTDTWKGNKFNYDKFGYTD